MLSRLLTFGLLLTCFGYLGCGEEGPEPIGETEVRIFTAQSVAAVDYALGCPDIEDQEPGTTFSPFSLEVVQPNQGNVDTWVLCTTLPEGNCTIALRGRDNDGEVVCEAEETFVVEGSLTQVDLILECDAGS